MSDAHLIGQKFNRLTIIRTWVHETRRERIAEVVCECGKIKNVRVNALKRGTTKSCGCWAVYRGKYVLPHETHGLSHTRTYAIWTGINNRCLNPNVRGYFRYGGRGITICDEWKRPDGFTKFLEHMGDPPSKKHTIERIDNDGDYEPGNCRWATWQEQSNNKRTSRILEFNGRSMTMSQWAVEKGIVVGTLWNRLKAGWSVEKALTTPILKRKS